METTLQALLNLFEEELARQEKVRDIALAQRDAALAHDRMKLEAHTDAIALLLDEAVTIEPQRLALLRELVTEYVLPEDQQTLSGLIEVLPKLWSARFADFQRRMRSVVLESRGIIARNNQLMQRSMHTVQQALHAIKTQLTEGPRMYTAQGSTASGRIGVALIDQQG